MTMSTVLIVEDDQEIRELIGDVLTLEGFTVHSMARLPHGLDRIRTIEPDVIVLDLGLPGIGGIELLRIIKEDPKLGSIPIVICSGAVDTIENHRQEFEDLGIPVLRKPFHLEQLLEAVRNPVRSARD
jgi:CheY-like chemotaxis protein